VIGVDRLKSLREEKQISQQKLAEQIGTNQQSIHRYEHGLYEPDIRTLKLIANYFKTSVDYLIGNTDLRHKIEPVERFDLNDDEASLIMGYRLLPANAQCGVRALIDALVNE